MPNIPGRPPHQPAIPGAEQFPGDGREWQIADSGIIDESGYIYERYVQVTKSQYWKSIHQEDIECGAKPSTDKVSFKWGISRTELEEFSTTLGVEAGDISAEVGAKLSSSVTITEERSRELTFPAPDKAPKCGGVTFVVWQLVSVYDIHIVDEWSGPIFNGFRIDERFEVPEEIWDYDPFVYVKEECCPAETSQLRSEGYDDAYVLRRETGSVTTWGRVLDDGAVELYGIDGAYRLGDSVPKEAQLDTDSPVDLLDVASTGEEATLGELRLASQPGLRFGDGPAARDRTAFEKSVIEAGSFDRVTVTDNGLEARIESVLVEFVRGDVFRDAVADVVRDLDPET